MPDLAGWLQEQLDEDERIARQSYLDPGYDLATVAAKREIIKLHSDHRRTLLVLAEPYSDRPGYQEATR